MTSFIFNLPSLQRGKMATCLLAYAISSAFLYSSLVECFLIPDSNQRVSTQFGDIIGFLDNVQFDGRTYHVKKFLGIPYAEPPIADLRFQKPKMKLNLTSPFVAQKYASICPQDLNITHADYVPSEDCLYLNIFTPSHESLSALPVMIWIHGGGFHFGFSDMYEGDVISGYADVIVVTFNYRLGILGFFSTHDQNAQGNYGLWDQHLAIRWVYEHIADFGGDTDNITVFGESAGASSVIYQMLYPGNNGLFKRAIAESGTIAAWAISFDDANLNLKSSEDFAASLGCKDSDNSKLVSCLRSQTESDVLAAAYQFKDHRSNQFNRSWVPVYDGEFVLARTPAILSELSDSKFSSKYSNFPNIDLMIGANNFDGAVFLSSILALVHKYFVPTPTNYNVTVDEMNYIIIPIIIKAWLGEFPSPLVTDLVINEYTNWNDPTNLKNRLQNVIDLLTDYGLNAPSIATAKAHLHNSANTYVYQFSATTPHDIRLVPPALQGIDKAFHADEIAYVFGFTERLTEAFHIPDNMTRPDDTKLSKAVMTMWTNFAKSGNPNLPVDLHSLYDVTWPEYDAKDEQYLEITSHMSSVSVKRHLASRAAKLWNNLIPKLQEFGKHDGVDGELNKIINI